ncbi:MAG: hypothetical protein NUW01_19945, partial [Gemmatimonadaceae bacterium]|nr:hypothetical protein [Gemmatimonadaceae bacterium]
MLRLRVTGHRYFPLGVALAASIGLMAAALGIYAPIFAAPWDVYDYADFLPLLVASSTFGEAFQAVSTFYAGHGRFQPLTHGLIALSWSLFG